MAENKGANTLHATSGAYFWKNSAQHHTNPDLLISTLIPNDRHTMHLDDRDGNSLFAGSIEI